MYCISCGAELPDQARFCMMCGTPVGGAVQVASTAESDSQELDRRALEVYLESLLALECAKHKHEKRCEVLEPHSWPDDDWLITRTYEAGPDPGSWYGYLTVIRTQRWSAKAMPRRSSTCAI